MPAWKVLLIILLACVCLALTIATIAIPIAQDGAQKWMWLGGLLTATLASGTLLTLFLRARRAAPSDLEAPRWDGTNALCLDKRSPRMSLFWISVSYSRF